MQKEKIKTEKRCKDCKERWFQVPLKESAINLGHEVLHIVTYRCGKCLSVYDRVEEE